MVRREDGETVRPDLVRGVAVGGDPVGARHHEVDLAAGHERRRRPVRDHGMRDGELLELPRREAAALQERPRLVDPDVRDATRLVRGADCSERRSVATRREPARVAVREDARSLREQLHRVRAHRTAALDLVGVDPLGPLARRVVAHRLERPAEVDRRRAGRGERRERGVEVVAPLGGERHAVRGRDPDGRSAANGEHADRLGELGHRPAAEVDLMLREQALVEHDDGVVLETDDPVRLEVPGHA